MTVRAVPQAVSFVRFLRGLEKKIGLCSNWDYAIQPYLDHSGLPEFDAVAVSAEIGVRKPNAQIFADVCSKLKVSAGEAVFIGDNWRTDIVGALRAGLTPVWIRHCCPSRGVSNAVVEFETLGECETYFRKLLCDDKSL